MNYISNPRALSVIVLAAVVAMLLGGAAQAGAAPSKKLPENYNFFAGIPYELAHPGGSLPGSNDYSCKPTSAHPRPVILVHGTGGSQTTNWGAYVPMLANRGYCVFALTYGAIAGLPWPATAVGGMGSIPASAAQLKRFITRVLTATGAKTVDIVGHSQGTYMPSYYLKKLGGAKFVTKYVSLAPLWRGTGGDLLAPVGRFMGRLTGTDGWLPVCTACSQMTPGSRTNDVIWAGGSPYVKGIDYTNISTRYDELVLPYTSGQVPGRRGESVRNVVVQDSCASDYSDHLAIAGSRRAAYLVLNALDPAHPVPVPCGVVPPFTG
ncbi:triacylglycerol lipase [Gordonia effusa NBRC 100432]|uniref:Triacylglycerol lipase n=1 Tax=Gordonia effusa NBRC 100432 TaxID=1077974 RepID=H0R198_9ACTN|nr:alpha/beta fold hydrolase [Gordonia effusa]GAB18849.1 triacylglycerol lipase [Gordonia effusa NBRC 100432]